MNKNRQQLSDNKTEVIILESPHKLRQHCVKTLCHRVNKNRLQLSDNKTEAIILESPHKLRQHCVKTLCHRVNKNRLQLSDNKTEVIILESPHKLRQINTKSIKVGDESIKAVEEVRHIVAHFDSIMKIDSLVQICIEIHRLAFITLVKFKNTLQ